jgi:hypothetical protein
MPLLHIAACSATHHYFSAGFCLLSGEAESDYLWALQKFRDVVRQDIKLPDVILTDNSSALKKALDSVFPEVPQLLCEFHINKNVESRLSKTFDSKEEMVVDEKDIRVTHQGGDALRGRILYKKKR